MSRLLCAASALALFASPALAQSDTPFALDPIIVSGGLSPIEASRVGRAATVITEEEIDAAPDAYVADILRRVPGVSVSRTGAFGGLTQVRIRGHEGNATKVLIDGIDVSTPSQGEFDFGGLLSADVAQIEILRGPQSSIYGANALGGVISITTKRASAPGLSGSVSADLGSDGSTNALIALRGASERGDISVSAAGFQTPGFDVSGTEKNTRDYFDSSENGTLSANGRYFVTESITVGAVLRFTDRSAESDDGTYYITDDVDGLLIEGDNRSDSQSLYGLAYAEAEAFGGRMMNRLEFSRVAEEFEYFTAKSLTSGSETDRDRIVYIGTLALDAATLEEANQTLGVSLQWQEESYKNTLGNEFSPPSFLEKQKRSQKSYVLEYRGRFGAGLDLQASVRHDDNEDFKDFTSYALGASYALASTGTRFHASVGTGAVNPTFSEQFGYYNNFIGNPDLKPEESFGWDIGVEQRFWGDRGIIDITYFDEEVKDEISTVYDEFGIGTPINKDEKSDRRGVELAGGLAIGALTDVTLAYTWLDAQEYVPASDSKEPEVRRPEHEVTLSLRQRLPDEKTEFILDLQHVSGLYDVDFRASADATGRTKLNDYTVVDLTMRHQLSDNVTLRAAVKNLFDEDYQELQGWATQGITGYLGLQASF